MSKPMPSPQPTVKVTHGPSGTRKVSYVPPRPHVTLKKTTAPQKNWPGKDKILIQKQVLDRTSLDGAATLTKMRQLPPGLRKPRAPPTIAQGTAAMAKGATPAMKKAALDRQSTFISDTLYTAMEKLGEEMKIEDPQFIFYFYHSFIKVNLEKELDGVRIMKTGGTNPPHLSQFVPLNKTLQLSPDIVELSQDVVSLPQLKFYKMLLFRIMETTNLALREAAFRGKIYLKKNFYSNFQAYWEQVVQPDVLIRKQEKEEKEQREEEEEAANAEAEEEVSLAQEYDETMLEEDEEQEREEEEEEVEGEGEEERVGEGEKKGKDHHVGGV